MILPRPDALRVSVSIDILTRMSKNEFWMSSAGSDLSGRGSSHRLTAESRSLSTIDCDIVDLRRRERGEKAVSLGRGSEQGGLVRGLMRVLTAATRS